MKEFFERLDEELNKVNEFYKLKEREFIERGEVLKKQLQILVELKRILQDRRRKSLSRSDSASSDKPRASSDFSGEPSLLLWLMNAWCVWDPSVMFPTCMF